MSPTPEPSLELLRAALEWAPAGILLVDERGRIALVNRHVEQLFGYAREELLGQPVEVLLPLRFRELHRGFREQFLREPRVRRMGAGRDLYGRRKDGVEVPLEIGLTPLETDQGIFVLSSIADISERKSAEQRFRLAVESSPSGMLMIDRDGRMVLVNREIERMFGYAREELLGRPIEMLVPERARASHPLRRAEFFERPERRSMGSGRELFGLRKDGAEIPVEIGLNPIETSEGLFVLGSVVDISARALAERERRELEDHLRQTQKMEAIGRLASGIAHDFKNVLAGILGCSNLALRSIDAANPAAELLTDIKSAADRGASLARQLLDFGRGRAGEPATASVNVAVRATERILRRVIGEDIRMAVELGASPDAVLADRSHLEQVVMNLAVNARDAMPAGGRLRIATRSLDLAAPRRFGGQSLSAGCYVVLEVQDDGVGMEEATRAQLFEPFFTTKPSGTGLGLYTVYGIVRQLGGAIEVRSEPGEGATFRVYLPSTAPRSAEQPVEPEAVERTSGGATILLVEDERLLRSALRGILTHAGYRVLAAGDPGEARRISAAEPGPVDVLLTDLVMPGESGMELAERLEAQRPGLRVLLMSAFPAHWLVAEGRIPAGVRVLEKPFEDDVLLQALRQALGSPAAAGRDEPA